MMFRRLNLLRMILAAFAIFYVTGSASATAACAMTGMTMPACGKATSDCADHQGHECQLACGTMCTAIEPSVAPMTVAKRIVQLFVGGPLLELPTSFAGLDPPPPRMG
jgi:hypothetical protein